METTQQDFGKQLQRIPETVVQVIMRPGDFFSKMSKNGGLMEPFLFMVALGVAAGLIQTVLALTGLSDAGGVVTGMAAVILMPIMVGIFGFVSAAGLYLIWKIMGSAETFEAAYRCGAYTAAIIPITILLRPVPYLGGIIGIVWLTYLIVVASVEAHGIKPKVAWAGFGIICALFVITSLSTEFAARRITNSLAQWQHQSKIDKLDQMSPEEAGKAMGDFMKGFGDAASKK